MKTLDILNTLINVIKPNLEQNKDKVLLDVKTLARNVQDSTLLALLKTLEDKYVYYLQDRSSLMRKNAVKDYYSRCLRRSIELLQQGDEWRLVL